MEEELPSASDVAKADDIELNKITKNAARSMENLIAQPEGKSSEDLPMHKLLELNKQLGSIQGGSGKKVHLEERIKKEKRKLEEIETIQNTTM